MEQRDIIDDEPIYSLPVTPDHELILWEKWIQIRRDEVVTLGKKLQRPPIDLTMNLLERVREDKERKMALEYAQIPKKTGVRGSLWDRPPRLKQRCYCEPVYELHRTRAEEGSPGVIEHIGVPTYIQRKELGMIGERERSSFPDLNAEYDMYRDHRETELVKEIRKVDPYKPDISRLMVKGRRPPEPPRKRPTIPDISVHEVDYACDEPLTGVYALKINNTIFYKEIPGQNLPHLRKLQKQAQDRCRFWNYYFNVPVKKAGRCKLYLQNLGTTTLRYCWKKLRRPLTFITEEVYEQVFFFNKNEDVICPGQSKEINFTFIADQPGIYWEFWEFSTLNVTFFDNVTDMLLVNLYGDSVEDVPTSKRRVEVLKTRINRKALNNFASEFVEEIFDKVFEVVPQIYPYKEYFVEAEIFVMKNPVCFYHQTEVGKMKDLYTEMVPKHDWDLSIGSWRRAMMAKEFDDRMKYYELLQKSHSEVLKPWYEGDGLAKEKERTVKYLLGQFADRFDSEYNRITDTYIFKTSESGPLRSKSKIKPKPVDPIIEQTIKNVFYVCIYDHFGTTIELCAGVLSSLDLNRWIEFDFCRRM
ncbi:hypothetical protein B5X24_HaOG207029 [Helicoverpa armigera]|uniref:MYCBP-associated protein n=1 Tax=Helicoverpa armigera TaxID=29058 RepID=A0A2W1BMT0_HELAM|nr:hypothetical protein B5X24_HaOG207029 [Helicoverpa armigera]